MFLEVDEAEFRADPDAMLDRIRSGYEAVVIKADRRIIGALVNPRLFEQAHRMHDRIDEIRANFSEASRSVWEKETITETQPDKASERSHH